MTKQAFLMQLQERLSGLPQEDIAERLSFYDEMINDRIEDGLSEEEAVSQIGTVDEVVSQILTETPITKLVKEKVKSNRKMKAWEIVLLVLGFPLWFPLLIAAFAILLAVYIVIWSVIVAFWGVDLSFAVSAVSCLIAGIVSVCMGLVFQGLVFISGALVLAALAIFLFFACKAATKGAIVLTNKVALGIKSIFLRN